MEIKNLFSKTKERTIKSPWMIEEINNGLKARNGKIIKGAFAKTNPMVAVVNGVGIMPNKKIPVQYFEYDRIFGRGAFDTILKVMEMFDELLEVTPETIGYIFKESIYLNYSKGILKRNNKTGEEEFYSEESLRNTALSCYLKLDYQDPDYEENPDREEVHNTCTELQRSTD